MNKKAIVLSVMITALTAASVYGNFGEGHQASATTSRIHFQFRWNDPTDWSNNQQKWTKSAYNLQSTTVSVPSYYANAWGRSYKAGKTGNVDVSEGHTYTVYSNHTYGIYNKLVEWYGKGNNAFIHAWSYNNGDAWGNWSADR